MTRADGRLFRAWVQSTGRYATDSARRVGVALRAFAFGTACTLLCACGGGGGGGSDDSGVVAPPQKAELSWDNGNWDQQEWK